jgi:hypothetical protein
MPAIAEVRRLPNFADVVFERAVMDAIRGLARFSPTRVIGAADAADAENLKSDLLDLCEIVDPLVEAFGVYVQHHFGLMTKDRELFRGQLRGAISGDAAAVLQGIADQLRERSGDRRHDFMRSARSE